MINTTAHKFAKVKVAVLISGRGSNLAALIEACKNPAFPAEIAMVISNKKTARGLNIAKENNLKTYFIDHTLFNSRQEFDQKLSEIIEENNCQLICLAGFMRLLSSWFVNKWHGRVLNIHPSLLPAFKGANAVEDALLYGVKYTGCTVHFVAEEMDSGPIIKQEVVEIKEGDDKESLASRILQKEHLIYPDALKLVCNQILKIN